VRNKDVNSSTRSETDPRSQEGKACPRRQNRWLALAVLCTSAVVLADGVVLWGPYRDPVSRFYTSALGYAHVARLLKLPFTVDAGQPEMHEFTVPVLGEGTMLCDFYFVPVVPMARVTTLHIEEGDTVSKGQLLAELDDTTARLNLKTAELAVGTANAERERVSIGSAYVLAQERPERDRIDVGAAKDVLDRANEKLKTYRDLVAKGVLARESLLDVETAAINAQKSYDQSLFDQRMSTQGSTESRKIAQNAVEQAETLLRQRQEELKGYHVTSPADGIIQRVLIRPGEFNQDTGKPGFIVCSGLWFDAHLDQRTLANVHEGCEATVFLESYPGQPFPARVERIIPVVTFDAGGPETTRPIRPRGTGAPEWPATYTARLVLETNGLRVTPGMTGFARVTYRRRALAIPRDALTSLSAGKGIVRQIDEQGIQKAVEVRIGEVDDRFVEVVEGLDPSALLVRGNHRFLRDGDRVQVTEKPAKLTSR
jgi:HlyD family secretion protein